MNFSSLFFRLLLLACLSAWASGVQAVTYANKSIPFSWVSTATHTRVGSGTTPYKFNGTIAPGTACGTTPPILDDTISDNIPLGFNFNYGGMVFSAARIMSNGRLQFNNNTACGYGSPVQQLPYVYYNSATNNLNYSMRIYGNDLDPTPQADAPYTTACKLTSTCYISYASIGTAPNRQFVVTWNNIPEWAAGGSTSGNYNLQLILNEDGSFIYQYGVDVPGPQAPLAQVGWQVSQTDFDVPNVGLPANNSAIKFYIPDPVAQYHFQQSAWTAPGQVLDTSGSSPAYNGTALGGATPGAGYVCNGAVIPDNIGGTVIGIDTGIPITTAVGGAGTIDFWYKANVAWVGGGDAQLLDATMANNQWFFAVKRDNGDVRFVITDSTGTTHAVETPANNIAAGTWTHIALTWNFNALAGSNKDHMSIYINGVQTALSAFTTSGTVSSQVGTLYLGDNRSSFTGSNGTKKSANGTLDEVNVYNFEGGTGLIQRDMNYTSSCSTLDHFAISNSGTGVNCQAEPVTITAHDTSHSPVPTSASVSITTSTNHGDWALQTGAGTLVNSGNGAATYTFNNESSVVLLLKDTFPETTNINLNAGGITESATEDPSLTFAPSGFRFLDAAYNPAIANQVAGVTSGTYYLQAIRTDTNTGACVGVFNNQTVNIDLASQCNNPTTCAGQQVSFNGSAIASNPNSGVSSYTTLPVTFLNDSTSRAAFTFVYPDVGQISLHARYNIPLGSGGASPNNMVGSSNLFVVKPFGFSVSNIKRTSDGFANPGAGSATGTAFIKAGDSFTATVTALANGGAATPNYGRETVPEGVLLTPNIVLPAAGNNPALSNGTIAGTEFGSGGMVSDANGVATVTNLAWGEVGIITLTPSVGDGDYLNAGNVTGTTTGNIGRFYPDHFVLTTPSITNRSDLVCGSTFTYMGEPMSVMFKLTAQNTANTTTKNYIGSFAKLDGATVSKWTAFGLNDSIGLWAMGSNIGGNPACKAIFSPTSPFTTTFTCPPPATVAASAARVVVSGAPTGTWLAGVGTFSGDTILNRANAVDGSYEALEIGVAPRDADGVQLLGGALDLDADNSGSAERKNLGNTKMRYGRVRLSNAIGSERLSLPVPLKTQYFNGAGFVGNTDDSCTQVPVPMPVAFATPLNPGLTFYAPPTTATNILASGDTTATINSASSGNGTFASGDGGLMLSAPFGAHYGYVDIVIAVPAWLQFNWSGVVGNPKARATFGAYRSTDQFIYQRENY